MGFQAIKQRLGLEVVAQAENGTRALEQIRCLSPDVAILAVLLPEMDGIEVAEELAREGHPTQVLFLSASLASDTVYRAVAAGARGYISKHSPASAICDAVAAVACGEMVLASESQKAIAKEIRLRATAEPCPLSERELEVLGLIADGRSVGEIATLLYLSPSTVKTHVKRTYRKLGVSGRGAAVAEAMRRGLFGVALCASAWGGAAATAPTV